MFGFGEKGALDAVNKELIEKINPIFKDLIHLKKHEPIKKSICDALEQQTFDDLGKEYNVKAQEETGRTHLGMYDDWNNGEDKDNCSVRKRMLYRKFDEKRGTIWRVISELPEHQAATAAYAEELVVARAAEQVRLAELAEDEREAAIEAERERLTGLFNESNDRGKAALNDFEARERANFPTNPQLLNDLIKQRKDTIIVVVEVQTGPDGEEIGSEDEINAIMDETFASMISDNNAMTPEKNLACTGLYFKTVSGKDRVFWSASCFDISKDKEFSGEEEYFAHREVRGLSRSFDEIDCITLREGLYFKVASDQNTVLWSRSTTNVSKDFVFGSQEQFNAHRLDRGLPEDYSDVDLVNMTPGLYFRIDGGGDTVFYSKSANIITKDIAFSDTDEFNAHRADHGLPEDFSGVSPITLSPGFYFKTSKSGDTVYWSQSTGLSVDVAFTSPEHYLNHLRDRGQVEVNRPNGDAPTVNLPEDHSGTVMTDLSAGHYFKTRTGGDTVYWSQSIDKIQQNVAFSSMEEYVAHRVERGLSEDCYIDVMTLPAGTYFKIPSDENTIFWSYGTPVQKEVAFQSWEQYVDHRLDRDLDDDGACEVLTLSSGKYFKTETGGACVYWSRSCFDIQQDVAFSSPDEFFTHRSDHGWPQNWDGIENLTISPGLCFKTPSSGAGVFASKYTNVRLDVAFGSRDEFFSHRAERGLPQDFSDVFTVELPKGYYFKTRATGDTIFWSLNTTSPKKDVIFSNRDEFVEHREARGMDLESEIYFI